MNKTTSIILSVLGAVVIVGGAWAYITYTKYTPTTYITETKTPVVTNTNETTQPPVDTTTDVTTTGTKTEETKSAATTTTTFTTTDTNTGETTPGAPKYTMAQVATHNDTVSCYTAVSGVVYDLTLWVNLHPGGKNPILSLCGTDGTQKFMNKHNGAEKQMTILARYKIGLVI